MLKPSQSDVLIQIHCKHMRLLIPPIAYMHSDYAFVDDPPGNVCSGVDACSDVDCLTINLSIENPHTEESCRQVSKYALFAHGAS